MSSTNVCQELQELRALLECPVCFEAMRNIKVRTCRNGHSICNTCFLKLTMCPVCRSDTWCRSITLENIGKLIPQSPCLTSFAQQYQSLPESSTERTVYNPTLTVSETSNVRAARVPEIYRALQQQYAVSTSASTTIFAGTGHSRAVHMSTAQSSAARSSRLPISSISYATRGVRIPRNEGVIERRDVSGSRPRSEVVRENTGRNSRRRVDGGLSTTRHVERPAWR